MKNHYTKHIHILFSMILFLCLAGIVFCGISQDGVIKECLGDEDVLLKTVTVYIGGDISSCTDTIVIENINLHIKTKSCAGSGSGSSCGDGSRNAWFLLNDIDTLRFVCGLSDYWWKKKDGYYPAIIDSVSLRMLRNTIRSFERSRSSCLNRKFDARLCGANGQMTFNSNGKCTIDITDANGIHINGKGTYEIAHGINTTIAIFEGTYGDRVIDHGEPLYLYGNKIDIAIIMGDVVYNPCK